MAMIAAGRASAEDSPHLEKLTTEQPSTIDNLPSCDFTGNKAETQDPSHDCEKSLNTSKDAESSEPNDEHDAKAKEEGKDQNKDGIGCYFVSYHSDLSIPSRADYSLFAASLPLYGHARSFSIRNCHPERCGHWRSIAFDDLGLRIINELNQWLWLRTRRFRAIPGQNPCLGTLVRVSVCLPLRHRLPRNTMHMYCGRQDHQLLEEGISR